MSEQDKSSTQNGFGNDPNPDGRQSIKDKLASRMSHIKGWAIDANPKNDPTFPIRHRFPEDSTGYRWERPVQQGGSHDVFHSAERPDVTRVFGTSAPAQGFSGSIRRCAFKFSEGRFAHWLLLLAADRVNMLEDLRMIWCADAPPNASATQA